MRSPGFILTGDPPFQVVIRPLAAEVAPCFWLIDEQQGPFDAQWRYASPENEALHAKQWFDAPACRDTSSSCWRPHTFPRLSAHVYVDEWTYFFAMQCGEEEVTKRAEWIVRHIGVFTGDFFSQLSQVADLFLLHADGWWEFYTSHGEWRRKFREAFPGCYERSWQMAGEPPVRS